MNILITDGENRSTLAATRSLGRNGCRVVVTGQEMANLASRSRFCEKSYSVPSPLSDGDRYVEAIKEISKKEYIDIIFPMTEQTIYLLNAVRKEFHGNTILACPSSESIDAISNKVALCHRAEELAVPIPQTLYFSSSKDLPTNIGKIERYPVVVKPAFSRLLEGGKFISGGVKYASSPKELELLYANDSVLKYPSLVQEKIVGQGTGLFTLYDGDRHLALFSHRRLREKPPSGGVSVISESVPLDDEMVEEAGRLLSAVGWKGVAMVEFKRDQRDGKAKLMEINGRFWGSLQLAIACGVDFPVLLLDLLQGKTPTLPLSDYQVGHKLKWFFGTLDHLLIRLKYSIEKLNLPADAPTRLQAIMEFLKIFEKNTSFDVFDQNDRGPFWHEARSYVLQAMKIKE